MSAEIIDIMGKKRVAPDHVGAHAALPGLGSLSGSSPELVALANALAAGVERFCNTPGDGPNAITEANDRIWAKIEAFAPRSIADVLAKCDAGEIYFGEDIPKKGEYAVDHILLLMLSDLERLARKGGAA